MIEEDLRIAQRGAPDLVIELRLREAAGRGRYRAWGYSSIAFPGWPFHPSSVRVGILTTKPILAIGLSDDVENKRYN
jgi:hypothetical protein